MGASGRPGTGPLLDHQHIRIARSGEGDTGTSGEPPTSPSGVVRSEHRHRGAEASREEVRDRGETGGDRPHPARGHRLPRARTDHEGAHREGGGRQPARFPDHPAEQHFRLLKLRDRRYDLGIGEGSVRPVGHEQQVPHGLRR